MGWKNAKKKCMFAHKFKVKMTKHEDKLHPLRTFAHCPVCGSRNFVVNNEKSKRCEDCGFQYYFNPSSSTVAVIMNEREEVLVVRRAKEPAKGTLDLPGGFCDSSETAEEGVVREVMEETGLSVEGCEYLFSLPNIYPYSGFEVHTLDMFFLCRVRDGQAATAMDDAESLMWIPWDKVMPDEFGLHSIRQGVKQLKRMWQTKK